MALPSYDISKWPLVVIEAPASGATDEEMTEHMAKVAALYSRAGSFAMVVDVTLAPRPPPGQRRLLGDALTQHERSNPGKLKGMAMVVASDLQRGIITAVSWFFRPSYPMRVFSSREQAVTWARSMLDGAQETRP